MSNSDSDNVYGFVPAVGNPLNTDNRYHGASVRGGYVALHGEPAIDWAGLETLKNESPAKKRGRPRKGS
jgi:hypothetical protein